MALQTTTTIKIGQTIITNFSSLKITQKIHDHHTFSIKVRQHLLVDEFKSVMPVSQQLSGENISIEIKPLPGLNDLMIITSPKDYIMQFYGIVTKVKSNKSRKKDMEETILIEGYSTSVILDNGPESNSFTQMTLAEIVNKVKSAYSIDMEVSPFFADILSYTVQYNESDFDFLNRLAKRHGHWFFYNGRIIVFGGPGGGTAQKLMYGINMHDFSYNIKLIPSLFKVIENDNKKGDYAVDNTINYRKETNGFHQNFINKSNQVFSKENLIQLNQNAVGGFGQSAAEEYAKNKMRSSMSKMMQVKASSEVPGIMVGSEVKISGVDKQHEGFYRVTKLVHTCDDGGGYENHFTAVNFSDSVFSPKTNPDLAPICKSQTAVVIANADPDGLSGIKVQMPWQEAKGKTTPYIPMVQKYGGNGKGAHWIPEIGEKVFVDFQGGNAELPIVVGTMTSTKEKSSYSTENNDIKALHTRSNNLLLMNDAQGSILLQDSAKSFINMDGNRRVEINTDELHINVKKLIINASQSTEITTNDYILHALSKIYVLSKTMKQKISGFMNLFSGTALINSNDKINIEAKVTKLHGSEKAMMHSDKETVINSRGTAKMHGTDGNSLTNKAQTVEKSPTDTIALAVVYFRPLDSWAGEFGFDWMREVDDMPNSILDYESLIEGGYKDGKSDLSKPEAYEKLKLQYDRISISRKATTKSSITEYFVPYLTLFSKEFVEAMPKDTLVKPEFEAELRMLVDIEENLEKLEFDYDKTSFAIIITKPAVLETAKTQGLKKSKVNIKIQCLKDLNHDHEINIYAYPKNNTGRPKTEIETVTDRKLAGKIIVLKNDSTVRKEEKLVLVRVATEMDDETKELKIEFAEKTNLFSSLHQAFIIPIVEFAFLDLTKNPSFIATGKHVEKRYIKLGLIENGKTIIYKEPFIDCQNAFFNVKDPNGVLVNERYRDYFTVFKFGITSNIMIPGCVQEIGVRNVLLFQFLDDWTLSHEALHGLGLCHTHRNSTPIIRLNAKYIFTGGTDNIMSYGTNRSTWRWQWNIMNSNIKEK
jgi:type VI secretion system secreted protein VgrG